MAHPLQQAFEIFAVEYREESSEIARVLLDVGREPDLAKRREQMEVLFRHAHTVKGTAGSLGLSDLEGLAHALETSLTPCRSGEKVPSAALCEAVLRGLDLGQGRVMAMIQGNEAPDPQLSALAASLLKLAATAAEPAAAAPPPRSSPQSASPATIAVPQLRAPELTPSAATPNLETVRVASARLDALERQVEGMREVRVALDRRVDEARRAERTLDAMALALGERAVRTLREQLVSLRRSLGGDVAEFAGRVGDLDDELRLARMVTLESVVAPLTRAVWEHANSVGKRARLVVQGADLAVDRRLLDEVRTALTHLVRNAVDHGIEAPKDRAAHGKAEEGQVSLEFEQRGPHLVVVVRDDGAGVDLAKVRRKAVEKKLLGEAAAAALDPEAVRALLFEPGFSTAEAITRTSGRGVGLDVVRDNVQRLGGSVVLQSELGHGSAFVLQLPLTLATTQGVLLEAGGFILGLPLVAVARALHETAKAQARETLDVDGRLLPLRDLRGALGLPPAAGRAKTAAVVLVRHGSREVALRVDRLVGERELVFKPLPPEFAGLRHLAGAAPLGDGRLVFLLSARALVEAETGAPAASAPVGSGRRRILVADDSLTTRTLHRQVLEALGYDVETAANGEEAWEALRRRLADLVVSDVQMPRLDGLGLARRMRAEPATASLPIILVSSLDSEDDARRAREAGASAYLTKQAYQRGELSRLVHLLLGEPGAMERAG